MFTNLDGWHGETQVQMITGQHNSLILPTNQSRAVLVIRLHLGKVKLEYNCLLRLNLAIRAAW